MVHAQHLSLNVQREDAGEGEPAGGQAEPAALRREPLPTDNAPAKAESGSKHKRVLRTYGQKKAKADSSADDATATLTPDFLALVGGQR